MFTLIKKDNNARRGRIQTAHGSIETPFFMPVGTCGTVKSLSFEELKDIQAQIVLSNTYHLFLRPGMEIMREAGGLHQFIGWDRPMLTDSGGYQVFSLTKLRKITDKGVRFQSHLDGAYHFFSPEDVMEIERTLGSDMIMPLDVCAPYPCERKEAEESVRLTTLWAKRSKDYFYEQGMDRKQNLFGIIQGATYEDLRRQSTEELLALDLDGYAIGGVSVGEPVQEMFKALNWVVPYLPEEKPRYFMGIGLPDQIVKAVSEGVDMFDTCIPTRYGRHGALFTKKGQINLMNACYKNDFTPVDPDSNCPYAQNYTRAYVRHLLKAKEILGLKIVSYCNIYFYINMMREMRLAIEQGKIQEYAGAFLKGYNSELLRSGGRE